VVGIMTTCFVVNDELSRKDEWKFCALRRNRKTRIGSLDVGPQPVPHPVRSGSRARDPMAAARGRAAADDGGGLPTKRCEYHLKRKGVQPGTEREDHRHETSFIDRCGGGRRASVFGARLGTISQSIRWQLHGHPGSEPRRAGTDTVQLGPAHDRGFAAFGDAALFDVRYQLGDAPAPPGLTPCLARQDGRPSSRERSAIERRYRQPAERGRAAAAAGGELREPVGPSSSGDDASWAARRRAHDHSRHRAIAFIRLEVALTA
jgi:hypothetical protein